MNIEILCASLSLSLSLSVRILSCIYYTQVLLQYRLLLYDLPHWWPCPSPTPRLQNIHTGINTDQPYDKLALETYKSHINARSTEGFGSFTKVFAIKSTMPLLRRDSNNRFTSSHVPRIKPYASADPAFDPVPFPCCKSLVSLRGKCGVHVFLCATLWAHPFLACMYLS